MYQCEITVTGLVQGVGYRPFVAELAEETNITGQVKNAGGIVKIRACGKKHALSSFIGKLRTEAPVGARVDQIRVVWKETVQREAKKFCIVSSTPWAEDQRLLPADLPVCASCEKELLDPENRRFRYPFISCVSCGPRFSIMKKVPYDRESITMDDFPMCEACEAEYEGKGNIRRHAQTIACADCGPKLRVIFRREGCEKTLREGQLAEEQALQTTAEMIKKGKIAAIKDIGGFHFAFLPTVPDPARRLREFKARERKPFAVMFPNLKAAREYCEISLKEEELLQSLPRPIVLLRKKKDFCEQVCGMSDRMGVMLPCNPLQILLLQETGPLVMTSGNRGGEPIIYKDGDMLDLMRRGCPDLMLTHDRTIVTPLEDSIYQVTELGKEKEGIKADDRRSGVRQAVQVLRRGRGIVPEPVWLPVKLSEETFAAGGDLKAVFALGKGNAVYLSSHFGDLADVRSVSERHAAVSHMSQLFAVSPKESVGDLHPAYVSATGMQYKVQHHHAHIASVMAEHHIKGPLIGVAFDGTGYGQDHTVWGSEIFLCEGTKAKRCGCFAPVKLFGGDAGAKNAAGMLLAFSLEAERRGLIGQWRKRFGDRTGMREQERRILEKAYAAEVTTVTSSSMGRLFDAVSALLGIAVSNSYEGECAIALERQAAKAKQARRLEINLKKNPMNGLWQADSAMLIAQVYHALEAAGKDMGTPGWTAADAGFGKEDLLVAELALGFHEAVAHTVAKICGKIAEEANLPVLQVALSGGTFANRILLQKSVRLLEERGFQVFWNEEVPCGDGGLALGQMYLMAEAQKGGSIECV